MTLVLACLLVVAATCLGVVAPSPARAAAAGCGGESACLRVHLTGCGPTPSTRIVALSVVDTTWRDTPASTYQTRAVAGVDPSDEVVDGGMSLRRLATEMGCDPDSPLLDVRVRRGDTNVPLSPPAAGRSTANGYAGGLMPLFTTGGTQRQPDWIGFIRPLLAVDPGAQDTNSDEYLIPRPGPIDVFLGARDDAEVRIGGPVEKVKTRAEAAFTSTVSPSGDYDYAWDFGDGDRSTEANPRHAFALAGQYSVSLRVAGDGYGQSNVLRVTVDSTTKPPKPPEPPPKPPRKPPNLPGEIQDPTGTSKDPDAPVTGPNQGSDGKTGGAAPGPRVTDPGQGGTGESATDPDQTARQGKGRAGRRTPAPGDVRGVLLEGGGSVVPLGGATTAATAAGQEPTAPTARASSGGGGGLWWGAGLLPVLLLLGAAGEAGLGAALRTRLRRHG